MPYFGQKHVSDSTIELLAIMIFKGSQLYRLSDNINFRASLDSDKPLLVTDVKLLGREDFSRSCLALLFSLCSTNEDLQLSEIRRRIARIVFPHLVERTRGSIKTYTRDRPIFGKIPLPRYI